MTVPVVVSTTPSSDSSTSSQVDMPGTRPDGDLFVCVGAKDDNDPWTSVPGNWNEDQQFSGDNTHRLGLWWWFGSAEPAFYNISHDNEITEYGVLHITGAAAAVPQVTTTQNSGSSSNGTAPSITPTVNDTLLVRAIAVDRDLVSAAPATSRLAAGGGGANDVGIGISTNPGPAANVASGTVQFTHATDGWSSVTFAIAPSQISIDPTVGSLVLGGVAPAVTLIIDVVPLVGSLGLTGIAPIREEITPFALLSSGDMAIQNSFIGPWEAS